MGDSNPDPTSQINPISNTGSIARTHSFKDPSLEYYNVQQCHQNALFHNGLSYGAAPFMWIHFLIVINLPPLYLLARHKKGATGARKAKRKTETLL